MGRIPRIAITVAVCLAAQVALTFLMQGSGSHRVYSLSAFIAPITTPGLLVLILLSFTISSVWNARSDAQSATPIAPSHAVWAMACAIGGAALGRMIGFAHSEPYAGSGSGVFSVTSMSFGLLAGVVSLVTHRIVGWPVYAGALWFSVWGVVCFTAPALEIVMHLLFDVAVVHEDIMAVTSPLLATIGAMLIAHLAIKLASSAKEMGHGLR